LQTSAARDDELPDLEAEGGRGLHLVESLSADWGVHWPDDANGKVVWSVVTVSEASGSKLGSQAQLPRRVPAMNPVVGPVRAMNDLAVLERVRERLRTLP
jgi:hypothetical protein